MRDTLKLLAEAVAAAAVAGFGLRFSGNAEARAWALPAGLALLIGGTGYAFYLPSWVNAVVFLLVLFLLHQGARTRLERAARESRALEIPEAGLRLRSLPDPSKQHAGSWLVEALPAPAAARPQPGMAAFFSVPRPPASAPVPEAPVASTTMTLDFERETEDDYCVVLQAKAPRSTPGVAVCHHRDARGEALTMLADAEELRELPGLTNDLVARAVPAAYGFQLLDLPTLAMIADILTLRSDKREVYVHISGPGMRIVSNATFEASELPRLLETAARLLWRIHSVGVVES